MATYDDAQQNRVQVLRGIIIGRWFLIIGLGVLGVVHTIADIALISLQPRQFLYLFAVPIVYNSVYTIILQRPSEKLSPGLLRVLSFLQVALDQILFTFVIYFTGGVESVGFILYFFPVLAATVLYSDIQIITLAILNIAWYSMLITFEYARVIPHYARFSDDIALFGNAEATLANTMSVNLILLFTAMFAVFVNRIIHQREFEITIERDKVRTILNSLEDGIIMLDQRGRVLLMNPPARDLLRLYGHFEGPKLHVHDFPDTYAAVISAINAQTEKKLFGQEVLLNDGENQYHIEVDSIPILATDGHPVGWVKVLHDVTREKELDEIKSDFISVAAHQLRTPLAALKWFFKIMQDGDAGRVTKRQKELLEQAYDRNNEVIEIVNNLLDISEIEEGRFPYDFEEGTIQETVDHVLEAAKSEAQRRDITVAFDKQVDELPVISMDKQKIRMAIQNLVDNAVKYSPKGETVTVTAGIKNNRLMVTVSDTGIGIPKDEQKQIFSKFFRGHNAKEWATTGSGLGLYIVKNIVQKHRGQIWFESKQNQGTTFYLSFPIREQ